MMMETSAAGGETNSFRNNRYVEYKKGMAFNMFKPSDFDITPRKGPTLDEVYNFTIMKDARKDKIRIGKVEATPMVVVHAYTLHLRKIVQDLNLRIRIRVWDSSRPHKINMLRWHQHPSALPKGFYEGSDEVMLALYKLNEIIF